MGKAKKTRKFAVQRKILSLKDNRLKAKDRIAPTKHKKPEEPQKYDARQMSSALFFDYNTQLGPPYRVLLDTNFIHHSIRNKIDIIEGMTNCMYAKCTPYMTDCVRGEIESMGERARLALKIAKDPRIKSLTCLHKGIYADDCLVSRVNENKCYIVATCDKMLKRRIRKITGVPIMSVGQHKYVIERIGMEL